jgi:hypothetical protein
VPVKVTPYFSPPIHLYAYALFYLFIIIVVVVIIIIIIIIRAPIVRCSVCSVKSASANRQLCLQAKMFVACVKRAFMENKSLLSV